MSVQGKILNTKPATLNTRHVFSHTAVNLWLCFWNIS